VRGHRELAGEPPVNRVRHVLGPVGADAVVERHPGGDDEDGRPAMARPPPSARFITSTSAAIQR